MLLAAGAFALAGVFLLRLGLESAPARVTVSSGMSDSLGGDLMRAFARLAAPYGLDVRPVESGGAVEAIAQVDRGKLDMAFVVGALDFTPYRNIRQVVSLNVQPLHLLVKKELADAASVHLGALRGKVVDLGGGKGAASYWLARSVLEFAGLRPAPSSSTGEGEGDYIATTRSADAIYAEKDPDKLPDALFMVTMLPSPVVHRLVAERDYRLVPLPFRDAFALGALTVSPSSRPGPAPRSDQAIAILKERIADTVIPAMSYQGDPPIPPAPIHTLCMPTLLIANRRVGDETVERALDALFHSRFAKIVHPALDTNRLREIPEMPWHNGSLRYLARSQPILNGESLNVLVDVVTIAGPLCAGVLFLRHWLQQRTRFRSEQSFEAYMAKVSELERLAAGFEGPAASRAEEVERLSRELARLKAEALGRFTRGEIEGSELITSFLAHVNDARAHLNSVAGRLKEQ